MSEGYILERLSRTENIMLHGNAGLRQRLPEAFDDGVGTIGLNEFKALGSSDLDQKALQLFTRLGQLQLNNKGGATASIANMKNDEVTRIAREVTEFISSVRNWIEFGKKEIHQ